MIVGFTGTRQGMTAAQQSTLEEELRRLYLLPTEFHHGDCIGADEQAHALALDLNYLVVLHPPTKIRFRAFCSGASATRAPHPYIWRNHNIVNECNQLFACPESDERLRSGTWATIRYARKQGKPTYIITPQGEII